MGLLSRAGSRIIGKTAPHETLDEMGKALREKLGRLPQQKTTPHTALSLLKAYEAFQIGFCLSLKDRIYYSYTSVGLGIEKISIPQEVLWSEARAHSKYFKLDSRKSLGTKTTEKKLVYWVFPLDSSAYTAKEPWKTIMVLGTPESSRFNPEPVSIIIDEVADKMVMPLHQTVAEQHRDETLHEKAHIVEKKITLFHRIHLDFNCVVLENPTGQAAFCQKVSAMVDKTGTVIPLSRNRPLILFPIMLDRELIAHRLSKTLSTRILLSFEANNPENALIRIDSLI